MNLLKYFLIVVFLSASSMSWSQGSQKQFFVFLNTNADAPKLNEVHVQKLQRDHLANLDSLHKAGKLLAAGPFNEKGGILVLLADSITEAQGMLDSDPAVQSDRFIPEVFQFTIEYGNLCAVGEEYNMAEFQFIRLSPFPYDMKEVIKPKMLEEEHLEYISGLPDSVSVLLQGSLGSDIGKVLIYNTKDRNLAESVFQGDPYVRYMKYAYDIKTLWMAKESFCD